MQQRESRNRKEDGMLQQKYAQNHYTYLDQSNLKRFEIKNGSDLQSEMPSYYKPLVEIDDEKASLFGGAAKSELGHLRGGQRSKYVSAQKRNQFHELTSNASLPQIPIYPRNNSLEPVQQVKRTPQVVSNKFDPYTNLQQPPPMLG